MNSLNDIWQSILEVLSEKLTPTAMKTWFDDCTPVGLDGDSLVLHCPSEFKANIITTRYGALIKDALTELFYQSFDADGLARHGTSLRATVPVGRWQEKSPVPKKPCHYT